MSRYLFKSFADEAVDEKADRTISAYLNEMFEQGYTVHTYQQMNRWQFFLLEKTEGKP